LEEYPDMKSYISKILRLAIKGAFGRRDISMFEDKSRISLS
jgi:hypothetical protein